MTETSFLRRIASVGWTDDTAAEFEIAYGSDVRRLIVLHIWKAGLIAFRFDPNRAASVLNASRLGVFEDTLSDVWIALNGGLIERYLEVADAQVGELPFLKYLGSTIRNLVIENARSAGLLPRESIRAILRALCQARKESTRRSRTAQAKFRMMAEVESQVLLCLPPDEFRDVYSVIHHVADFFFERYLPTQCLRLRKLPSRRIAQDLVADFLQRGLDEALGYVGAITPWDETSSYRVCSDPDVVQSEDEFLSLLAVSSEAVAC